MSKVSVAVGPCWIPEAPGAPGLYAVDPDRRAGRFQEDQTATRIAVDALKFATEGDCAEWCSLNPDPEFWPSQHHFC